MSNIYTPIEKTKEQKVEEIINQIFSNNKRGLENLIRSLERGMELVWTPQDGITTQEIFDAITAKGIKVSDLFQTAGATQQFIATQKSDYVAPTIPLNYVINPDGSVTTSPKV